MKKMKMGVAGLLTTCAMIVAAPAFATTTPSAPGAQVQSDAHAKGPRQELRCGVRSDGVVYCEYVIVW